MNDHADRELVELARRGDGAAIGELFSRYWRAARAAAFGVTGEFASAEDAAAEAFRQALAGLDSLRDPDRFGSWLRTIVVRRARVELQSRRPTMDALADDLSDPNLRPDDAMERVERAALTQQALRELPDRLREAMALVYFEGYDAEATARFLDIPAGTLRRRLHDGRGRLRSTIRKILQGRKRMDDERPRHIERFKRLIDEGEIYQALRESLAVRPPPSELVGHFIRHQMAPATGSEAVAGGNGARQSVREIAQRFTRPSARASDTNHPVGSVAAAIRKVLPDFQDWPLDVGEAAAHFLTFTGEHRDRLQAVLPPGFAEGHPGAFVRATRALLHLSESGPVRSVYQLLQDSPDEQTFRAARNKMRISDALDLTWMVARPLELRSVQEMLERLSAAVLPGEDVRFSIYDEPRYRSALQLHVGGRSAPLAHGGVLAEWPGRPQGVDAAHLRIFLEPWATLQSGQVIEFDQVPEMPPTMT
jgi:RNA polymerase sigma factor (sigma-70 family)